jgi:hypothetical protein
MNGRDASGRNDCDWHDRDEHGHGEYDHDEYGFPLPNSNIQVGDYMVAVLHTFPQASSCSAVFVEATLCLFGIGCNFAHAHDSVHDCEETQNARRSVDCRSIVLAATLSHCSPPSARQAPVCLARKMVNVNANESGHDCGRDCVA